MDKTIHSLNARIKEEYELVTLFVRKVGDLNRRTGEFTFCQRFRESTDLNSHGFGSGDDGRYEIKTSLSDSIIEIGSTTHTLKTVKSKNNFVFSLQRDCHENDNKQCQQNGFTVCPSPLTSLIKEIPSAEKDENPTTVDVKVTEDERRAARLKQIKDFFTDPVDREIFPLSETKKPPSRPIITREIPSIEESVTKMLEQFRTAMRNEENVLETHRYGESAPPLGQVHTQSQRKINYQKNNEEIRPANQARNGYLIANDEEVRESESCSSVHEKVAIAHRTPWYVKLCCCGTITIPKKVKLENRQKSSDFLP